MKQFFQVILTLFMGQSLVFASQKGQTKHNTSTVKSVNTGTDKPKQAQVKMPQIMTKDQATNILATRLRTVFKADQQGFQDAYNECCISLELEAVDFDNQAFIPDAIQRIENLVSDIKAERKAAAANAATATQQIVQPTQQQIPANK